MAPLQAEPAPHDLHKVLSQVLESFAYALPTPRAEAGELSMTVRGVLPEEKGWLVLSCTPELARRLAADSTGDEGEDLAQDALNELCNLCVSHLVSELWGDQHTAFKPFVPVAGLPQGNCRSRVLLDLDGEPLEASYWTVS